MRICRGLSVILMLALLAPGWAAAQGHWTGRAVSEILDEAIRDGLRLIYSSQSVPLTLKVEREPQASDPITRLNEILEPHGLVLSPMAGGVWVVTRRVESSADQRDARSDRAAADRNTRAEMAEVTVTGSRYTLRTAPSGARFEMTDQDFESQPALLEDPLRAIRRFPGTAGTTYSSRTHVRGGQVDENLIVLDGVPLMDPFRRLGQPADLSLIDTSILDRVEFFPGVFPVEYGGRMSSVLRLQSQRATRPVGGRLALGFVSASALLNGQFARPGGDWLVSLRRSTLDLLAHAIEPDIGRPKLFDLFASAHYPLNAEWSASAGALSAVDEAEVIETDGSENFELNADRFHAWLGLDGPIGPVSLQTRLAVNGSQIDRTGAIHDEDGAEGDLVDRREVRSLLLLQNGTWPIGRSTVRFGWQASRMEVAYDYRKAVDFSEEAVELLGTPASRRYALNMDSDADEQGAYLSAETPLMSAVTVDAGVRWERHDYQTRQRFSRIDPRVSLKVQASAHTTLRLAWGQLTQLASAAELPVDRELSRFDPPSHSALWVLGLDYTTREQLLRIELYERRIRDPWSHLESLINPLVVIPELRPDQVLVAPARARSRGVDVHWSGRLSARTRGWLSYSYSHARDYFDGGAVPRSWDQPHAFTAGISTDHWGWTWAAMVSAHSGWPTTSVTVTPDDEVILGSRNAARLGWYGTLDLKAQREIALPRGVLKFTAELTNATDRRNTCCASLEFAEDDEPPKVDHDHWLPRLPLLSVAWEF